MQAKSLSTPMTPSSMATARQKRRTRMLIAAIGCLGVVVLPLAFRSGMEKADAEGIHAGEDVVRSAHIMREEEKLNIRKRRSKFVEETPPPPVAETTALAGAAEAGGEPGFDRDRLLVDAKPGGQPAPYHEVEGNPNVRKGAFTSESMLESLGNAIDVDALFQRHAQLATTELSSRRKADGVVSPEKADAGELDVDAMLATDDLRLVAGTGQRIFVAQNIKQIHHGVYRVEALAADIPKRDNPVGDYGGKLGQGNNGPNTVSVRPPKVLRFAFKTECRPAAKWHGQQGWGEVAAHRLTQLMQQNSLTEASVEEDHGNYAEQFEHAFDLNGYVDPSQAMRHGAFINTIAFAAGGILFITPEQLRSVVHKDQCGVMNAKEVSAWHTAVEKTDVELTRITEEEKANLAKARESEHSEFPAALREYGLLPTVNNYRARFDSQRALSGDDVPSVPLYGVMLTWNPNHNDDALPKKILKHFAAPKGSSERKKSLRDGAMIAADDDDNRPAVEELEGDTKFVMKEVSEIITLDYILGNEDREDKNWFSGLVNMGGQVGVERRHADADAVYLPEGDHALGANVGDRPLMQQRLIMMDNGWVFTGRNYKESICGMYESLLLCPPLLRHLTGSSKCKLPPAVVKLMQPKPVVAGAAVAAAKKALAPAAVADNNRDGDVAAVAAAVADAAESASSAAAEFNPLSAKSNTLAALLVDAPYPMCRFPSVLFTQLLRFGAAWVGEQGKTLAQVEAEFLPLELAEEDQRTRLKVFVERLAMAAEQPLPVSLAALWVRLVKNDLLIAHLFAAHSDGSSRTFDLPLARHTGQQCMVDGDGNPIEGASAATLDSVELISRSIGRRIARALRAAIDCVEAFGNDYVMMRD